MLFLQKHCYGNDVVAHEDDMIKKAEQGSSQKTKKRMPHLQKIETKMTRIAGEAQLSLLTEPDGIVKDVFFSSTLPIRAFGAFAKGKNPYFLIEGVKRICGVCHAVQGIAASMAMEEALHVSVPEGGRLLRELCGLFNRIQSHNLAQMLLLEDIFIPGKSAEIKTRLLKFNDHLCDVMAMIGGSPVHSPYITIGGMQKSLSAKSIDKLTTLVSGFEDILEEYLAILQTTKFLSEKYLRLQSIKTTLPPLFALKNSAPNIGKNYSDLIDVLLHTSEEVEFKKAVEKTTGVVALYRKTIVETGPRARMSNSDNSIIDSVVAINDARVAEMFHDLNRAKIILESISPDDVVLMKGITLGAGEGTGIYEAPRGVLIHSVKLNEYGRVSNYNIILPTMFNVLATQESIKELPSDLSNLIVRLYDPCMPCEVH